MSKHKIILAILLCICLLSSLLSVYVISTDAAATTHTIRFDVRGIGQTPASVTVNDGAKYLYLGENSTKNPTAEGYIFHCWTTTTDYEPNEASVLNAAYLETPVKSDMTLYAVWYKVIDSVDISIDKPVAGDVIGTKTVDYGSYSHDYQWPRPNVTVNTEGAAIKMAGHGPETYWLSNYEDLESIFQGTFREREEYGYSIELQPEFGYTFAENVTVTVNGEPFTQDLSVYYYDVNTSQSIDPNYKNTCFIAGSIMCGEFIDLYHTITFDVQGHGETPDPVRIRDGEKFLYRGAYSGNNPTAEGYVFHCWVTNLDFEQDEVSMANTAAYLESRVHEDMKLYAVWYKLVDTVEITVDPPVPGDVIGKKWYETEDYSFQYQSPRPRAKVTTEGVRVQQNSWYDDIKTYWVTDPNDVESTFFGKFENGKKYYAEIFIEPEYGYQFADQLTVYVNGVKLDKTYTPDDFLSIIKAPLWCGEPKEDLAPTGSDDDIAKPADGSQSSTSDEAIKKQGKATDDSATKDESSGGKSSSDSGVIKTGDRAMYVIFFLLILSFAAVILLRRKIKT